MDRRLRHPYRTWSLPTFCAVSSAELHPSVTSPHIAINAQTPLTTPTPTSPPTPNPARFPFRFPPPKKGPNIPALILPRVPTWLQHIGQLRVLDDDNIFLPRQERCVGAPQTVQFNYRSKKSPTRLPSLPSRRVHQLGGWRNNYVMPTRADTYVAAFRRWYDRVGAPPYAQVGAARNRT